MIDHTGSFTVSKDFQVRDWPKDFKINAPLQYTGGASGITQGDGTTPGDFGKD